MIESVTDLQYNNTENRAIHFSLIFSNIQEFGNFVCILIATKWVLRKTLPFMQSKHHRSYRAYESLNDESTSDTNENRNRFTSHLNTYETLSSMPLIEFTKYTSSSNTILHPENAKLAQSLSIAQVLSHSKSFDVFMQHLSREYSTECLLSYVEFAQYRSSILETMQDFFQCIDENALPLLPFLLPTNIPRSTIVYFRPLLENKLVDEDYQQYIIQCKLTAFKLYKKYIESGSEFEINISHKLRVEYEQKMESFEDFNNREMSAYDILTIFDSCNFAMFYLISDAFRRFASTTQFLKLADMIFLTCSIGSVSGFNGGMCRSDNDDEFIRKPLILKNMSC